MMTVTTAGMMRATRRAQAVAVLAVSLAAGAWILARPLLLGGTLGLGAWLLARQYLFTTAVVRTVDDLAVEQSLARDVVVTDETVQVSLTARLSTPAPVPLTVTASPPVGSTGASDDDRTVTIPTDEQVATTTFTVTCPVAGRHDFGPATVRTRDPDGLFRSTHETGSPPSVSVEPRAPRNIHVGEGGEPLAGAFGAHKTGQTGAGIDPAELRSYAAGDPLNSIDWKATARLGEPFVIKYDVETDLHTLLVVDHRASMADGPPGQTKLDFARQIALSYLATLRLDNMAIGLAAIGQDGLTDREPPTSSTDQYASLRLRLHELTPTTAEDLDPEMGRPPGEARRMAKRLADDTSQFGSTLRPFLTDREQYIRRIDSDPLYRTVRSQEQSLSGAVVTVIITDDNRPLELKEALEVASRGTNRVVAFLLPTVLFEPGAMADLDEAYDRYVEFEEFRRELAALPQVSAFEVAPGDRIEALLASRERRREA